MSRLAAGACPAIREIFRYFLVVETQKEDRACGTL